MVADIAGAHQQPVVLGWRRATRLLGQIGLIPLADQVQGIALLFLVVPLWCNKLSRRILLLLGRGFSLSENIVPQQQLFGKAQMQLILVFQTLHLLALR